MITRLDVSVHPEAIEFDSRVRNPGGDQYHADSGDHNTNVASGDMDGLYRPRANSC